MLSVTLLLMIIAFTVQGGGEITESSLQYWKRNLPTLAVPASLRDMVSPLQPSTASEYRLALVSQRSLGHLCKTGNLYCSAQDFDSFRSIHPVCGIKTAFRRSSTSFEVYETDSQGRKTRVHAGFFKEKALMKGAVLKLDEQADVVPLRAFLPRVLATELPFRSTSFLRLQHLFNIPESLLGKEIKATVDLCRVKQGDLLTGEDAACVSSMEDLVDLVKAKLLQKSQSIASVEILEISGAEKAWATASVMEVQLRSSNAQYLTCHNFMYPSSVFYCHHIPNTRVYSAKLQAEDGTLIDAVAVCHMDTSEWNPSHVAFFDLNAKPGHTEACHWTHQGNLVFVAAA